MTDSPDPSEDAGPYGPDAFMSDSTWDPLTQVNAVPPGGVAGGVIEATKRAVVAALREGYRGTSMDIPWAAPTPSNPATVAAPYIDLEYPLKEEQYPGIWVQFSIAEYFRSGLSHEVTYWDPSTQEWTPISSWTFNGRVTMSVTGLKSIDRDRMMDRMTAMLAFSRTPEQWVTKANKDTKQYRSFISAIDDNEYVSLTVNNDRLYFTGEGVDVGVPWQPDQLAYTNGVAFDVHGQTQIRFMHDGAYTLNRIDLVPEMVQSIPDEFAPPPDVLRPTGQGTSNPTWRTL